MSESFFMSNMSPQDPGFNRGIWKNLEAAVRKFALSEEGVVAVTGPIFDDNLGVVGERVTVPGYYFKVLYDYKGAHPKMIAFVLPNKKSDRPLSEFVVSVDRVEELTGIDFFAALDDTQEALLEKGSQWDDWSADERIFSRPAPSAEPQATTQCQAHTKAGAKCSRTASTGSSFCWQHKAK